MRKINRLKQEIDLCRKYKDVIGKRNGNLLNQYKQGALSKNEFSLKVAKHNYWVNFYDNHIKGCAEMIDQTKERSKVLMHNAAYLTMILSALAAIPLFSDFKITGHTVNEIQNPFQFAYLLAILLAVAAIYIFIKGENKSSLNDLKNYFFVKTHSKRKKSRKINKN